LQDLFSQISSFGSNFVQHWWNYGQWIMAVWYW
jgi:hypothetical protein